MTHLISNILREGNFPLIQCGMNYASVRRILLDKYSYDKNEMAVFLTRDDLSLTFRKLKVSGEWVLYHIYIYPGNCSKNKIVVPEQFDIDFEGIKPNMPIDGMVFFLKERRVHYLIKDILPDTKWIVNDNKFNMLFNKRDLFRLDSLVFQQNESAIA